MDWGVRRGTIGREQWAIKTFCCIEDGHMDPCSDISPWRSGQAEPQKPFEKPADVKDRGPTFGAPFHNWDQAFNPQRS